MAPYLPIDGLPDPTARETQPAQAWLVSLQSVQVIYDGYDRLNSPSTSKPDDSIWLLEGESPAQFVADCLKRIEAVEQNFRDAIRNGDASKFGCHSLQKVTRIYSATPVDPQSVTDEMRHWIGG